MECLPQGFVGAGDVVFPNVLPFDKARFEVGDGGRGLDQVLLATLVAVSVRLILLRCWQAVNVEA